MNDKTRNAAGRTDGRSAVKSSTRWVPYAGLLVLFWGVWGAFSGEPTSRYGYPDEMIYILWAFTMLIPAYFATRGQRLDRRPIAAFYGLLLVPVAFAMMGGFPSGAPWQAPVLTLGTQLLNAVGALFLVMALSRGKATIVAPVTNALAPVLTIVLSLIVFQTLPTVFAFIGILLAIGGSTLMVYSDESDAGQPDPVQPEKPAKAKHPS